MKTVKDTTGLITQDSIMVASHELNDASWNLVQSKNAWKERSKSRQEHMPTFPPLPHTQSYEVSVAKLSKKSA